MQNAVGKKLTGFMIDGQLQGLDRPRAEFFQLINSLFNHNRLIFTKIEVTCDDFLFHEGLLFSDVSWMFRMLQGILELFAHARAQDAHLLTVLCYGSSRNLQIIFLQHIDNFLVA